jgi:hypothetical protein
VNWGGGILFYIGRVLFKNYENKKNIKKLKSGKANDIDWIYGRMIYPKRGRNRKDTGC